jgi:hypothetical protein
LLLARSFARFAETDRIVRSRPGGNARSRDKRDSLWHGSPSGDTSRRGEFRRRRNFLHSPGCTCGCGTADFGRLLPYPAPPRIVAVAEADPTVAQATVGYRLSRELLAGKIRLLASLRERQVTSGLDLSGPIASLEAWIAREEGRRVRNYNSAWIVTVGLLLEAGIEEEWEWEEGAE